MGAYKMRWAEALGGFAFFPRDADPCTSRGAMFAHAKLHARGSIVVGVLGTSAALVMSVGCGSSQEWAPPPASTIPVPPGESPSTPKTGASEMSGSAELEALAGMAGGSGPSGASGTSGASSAVAAGGASPIPGALPADIDGKLAASAICPQKECALPGLYPASPAIDGKSPAAVWSHDIAAQGASVTFPKHVDVDLLGVVIKGSVKLKGVEAKEAGPSAAPWVAFRAPGAGVSVSASAAGTRVIFAIVGSGAPIADVIAELRGKDAKRLAWKDRPSPLQTVDLGAAKDLAWGGGAMHARIGFEGEGQKASFGVLMGSKDAPVAQHRHDTSWEILVALRGEGTCKRAATAAATELAKVSVSDGTVVAIPKGALHSWEPAGSKPLVAVQLYVPPGPEQRFKKLAEPVSAPAP
jgi:mannose-6-phosphate isomerase-like protein (cupin superfamily)